MPPSINNNGDSKESSCNGFKQSLDDRLEEFLKTVLLSDTEFENKYKEICDNLLEIFQPLFPKCKIINFGSTAVGVGFKNCDLDIYLDIGKPVGDSNNHFGPNIVHFDSLFSAIQNTLCRNSGIFTRIIPIPTAKMPIIKFIHRKTQISCDISFKHCIAVYNSELVKFYVSIDKRFKQLLVILKYWMCGCKSRKVISITNYALSMLFIFFLQQLKLVPTVLELQRKCQVPVKCDGWQVNFQKTFTFFDSNSHYKNRSTPELLKDFFEFYQDYDFESYVMCPLDGKSHNKKLFQDLKSFPSSMRYTENFYNGKIKNQAFTQKNKMCLQDPIVLNANLTNTVTSEQLDIFQSYASIYANVVHDSANNNYQDLLKNLHNVPTNISFSRAKKFSFVIHPNEFFSISSEEDIKQNDVFIKNDWFELTVNMIKVYLDEVLNFKLQINQVNEVKNEDITKVQLNNKTKNQALIQIDCKGSHCLWKDRKQIKIDRLSSPLEREKEISKILLASNKVKDSHNLKIHFLCTIMKNVDPKVNIFITLINKGCIPAVFSDVANSLSSQMPSVIKKNHNYLMHSKKTSSRFKKM